MIEMKDQMGTIWNPTITNKNGENKEGKKRKEKNMEQWSLFQPGECHCEIMENIYDCLNQRNVA